DNKPLPGVKKCPACLVESPEESEECPQCGNIFEGKQCIDNNCGKTITKSSVICPHCGANQVPEIRNPWRCEVCREVNLADDVGFSSCSEARSAPEPLAREALMAASDKADDLSTTGVRIMLASGEQTAPIDVNKFLVDRAIVAYRAGGVKERLPSVRMIE